MDNKSIEEQLCIKLQRWNQIFRDKALSVNPESSVWFELERFFPYFVLVERDSHAMESQGNFFQKPVISGRIGFVDRNNAFHNINTKIDTWYHVEPWNKAVIEAHLAETQPQSIIGKGGDGWIIPLYEGNRAKDMHEVNAYLHNLMFWESLIVSEEAGPIMQRTVWLMEKVYDQREEMDMAIREMREHGLVDHQEGHDIRHVVKKACDKYDFINDEFQHKMDEIFHASDYRQKSLEEKEIVLKSVDSLFNLMGVIHSTIERNCMAMENIAGMMRRLENENQNLEHIHDDWAAKMDELLQRLEYLKKHG